MQSGTGANLLPSLDAKNKLLLLLACPQVRFPPEVMTTKQAKRVEEQLSQPQHFPGAGKLAKAQTSHGAVLSYIYLFIENLPGLLTKVQALPDHLSIAYGFTVYSSKYIFPGKFSDLSSHTDFQSKIELKYVLMGAGPAIRDFLGVE